VIQLSIAPVFMLTAIGSFLAVITQRLARAVDRARELEDRVGALPADSESLTLAKEELYVLSLPSIPLPIAVSFPAFSENCNA
jgi:hypothetical protein